jgi:hypothetical protein
VIIELYLHPSVVFHEVVLNELSTGTTLPLFLLSPLLMLEDGTDVC